MHVGVSIGGALFAILALGHFTVGMRWVLPHLTAEPLPKTPFGPASMTLGMLRFTWHITTVVLVGFSSLLFLLAIADDADARILVLRWVAAMMLAATATALWNGRRRLRSIPRFPVPVVTFVIAVLCWMASS